MEPRIQPTKTCSGNFTRWSRVCSTQCAMALNWCHLARPSRHFWRPSTASSPSILVKDTKGLDEHVRKGFVRKGLNIVSQKGDRSELPFIRKSLADDFVGYSAADIDYLTRHGEWQDIELIISMVDRHDYVTPSPWVSPDKKNRHAAVAIHRIGKNRIEELIAMPMPASLLEHLVNAL